MSQIWFEKGVGSLVKVCDFGSEKFEGPLSWPYHKFLN